MSEKGNKKGFNAQIFKQAVKVACGLDQFIPVQLFDAIVQSGSQDEETMTCYVDSVDSTVSNLQVRYNLCISDGLVCVPADGSTVTIAKTAFTDPYIVKASDLSSCFLGVGNQSWSNDGTVQDFEFWGSEEGSFGGFIKVKDPLSSEEGLLKKINNLENLINDLIIKYNSHTHILTLTSGTGTAAPTVTIETGTIAPITTESDLTNPHIIHGLKKLPT